MKKIIISGIIQTQWDDWNRILIIQPDGYKIDLISRLRELKLNSSDNSFQLNYHLCDKPLTEVELKEAHILSICGALDADYEANEYHYSSWTHGCDYDTVLKLHGHDLYSELDNSVGKWIYFEINYK